jgi:hypothetical protein
MKHSGIFYRLLTFASSLSNFAGSFRGTLASKPTRQHYDFHTSPDGVQLAIPREVKSDESPTRD